jgi:hypothetical protein
MKFIYIKKKFDDEEDDRTFNESTTAFNDDDEESEEEEDEESGSTLISSTPIVNRRSRFVGCYDWTFINRTMCLLSSYFLLTFQRMMTTRLNNSSI